MSIKTLLNSPRTLEACRRQGIDPVELDPTSEDQVRKLIAQRDRGKRAIPQVLVDIRMRHYEDKRRDMIRIIKEVGQFRNHLLGANGYHGGGREGQQVLSGHKPTFRVSQGWRSICHQVSRYMLFYLFFSWSTYRRRFDLRPHDPV